MIQEVSDDPAAVHAKLAGVYDKLGRGEMAEQHRLLEEQLRGASSKPNELPVPEVR